MKLVYQYLKRFPGAIDTLETKLNAQSIKAGFDILSLFSKRDLLSNNMVYCRQICLLCGLEILQWQELVLLFGQLAELDYYLHTLIRESFASDPRFQQIQNQVLTRLEIHAIHAVTLAATDFPENSREQHPVSEAALLQDLGSPLQRNPKRSLQRCIRG